METTPVIMVPERNAQSTSYLDRTLEKLRREFEYQ